MVSGVYGLVSAAAVQERRGLTILKTGYLENTGKLRERLRIKEPDLSEVTSVMGVRVPLSGTTKRLEHVTH